MGKQGNGFPNSPLQAIGREHTPGTGTPGIFRNKRLLPFLCGLALILAAASAVSIARFNQDTQAIARSGLDSPDYYLWAWRRTEDLTFVNSRKIKAAIWTGTIFWEQGRLAVDHRRNPITYPVGMEVVAVSRLEITGIPDPEATAEIARAMWRLGESFDPIEYQIDFDARRSQRDFYSRLLGEVRSRIGSTPLSITALASWCFHDAWIEGLTVDAVVPMIYRMGPEGIYIRRKLKQDRTFPSAICRGSVGYSSDEPLAPVDDLQRVFLFHPQPWNERRLAELIEKTARL